MELDQFITLRQLTNRDVDALLTVVPNYEDVGIDILQALDKLKQHRMIEESQFESLARKFATLESRNRFAAFIMDVIKCVGSFRELVKCLHHMEFSVTTSLAEELEVERYHRQMYFIGTTDVPNGPHIVKYYTMMKNCSENDSNRRRTFLARATDLKKKLPNIANRQERQWTADRYATIMQLRTKYYTSSRKIEGILHEMLEDMPEGIDTRYTDVLYHSKFAMSRALDGDERSACDHIQQVFDLCPTSQPPFLRTFSFYYLQYVYRCLYSQNQSQEYLSKAESYCNLGLHVLTEMDQSDTHLIRRVFLLNLIQTLLGINADFSVDHNSPVKAENLHAAEEHLLRLKQTCPKIESRREMIYYLCKARTLQDKDLFLALTYLDQALVSGKQGAYLKTNTLNIAAYQKWLLLRELPQGW